jgi:hypothetical protein
MRQDLRRITVIVLATGEVAALTAIAAGDDSYLVFQLTIEAIAVGFAAIFFLPAHRAA